MAIMEWEHTEEDEINLETWSAFVRGVYLKVEYVMRGEEDWAYVWQNNLTGNRYRTGKSDDLKGAMREAIQSIGLK